MNALPRPLPAMMTTPKLPDEPVAVVALGQHAGATVAVVVDTYGDVSTVTTDRLSILDDALQAVAHKATELRAAQATARAAGAQTPPWQQPEGTTIPPETKVGW